MVVPIFSQYFVSNVCIFTLYLDLLGTLVASLSLRLNLDFLDSERDRAKWIDRQTARQIYSNRQLFIHTDRQMIRRSVVWNLFVFYIVGGGVKMMPCKADDERQGWKRDLQSSQIVATHYHFNHPRRVLHIRCMSLSCILNIQESN